MEQYINKAAVVAEIERRVEAIRKAFNEPGILSGVDRTYAYAQYEAFKSLFPYLDSLEVKEVEEPSKDLEEAADNYVGHAPEIDEDLSCFTKRNAFIAGAQWKKERILNVATEREVKVDVGGYPYIDFTELYDFDKDIPLAKKGDKVKLVIVKNLNG